MKIHSPIEVMVSFFSKSETKIDKSVLRLAVEVLKTAQVTLKYFESRLAVIRIVTPFHPSVLNGLSYVLYGNAHGG